MKKIKIIRRNFVLSLIMFSQYIAFMHFVWPEFMAAVRAHSIAPMGWPLAAAMVTSGIIAGCGYGLFTDTVKAWRNHRLWLAGFLTDY